MSHITDEIKQLKKEKNAVILAHYYVNDDVQALADYIGDSFYLSKIATQVSEDTIVFCGVSFMGESAKILNPTKTVLMPDESADCPMAHMADIDEIEALRKQYDDLAVVCYINSTSELKAHADVCVTSSNAEKIVKALPNKNIYFIPDEHLGQYIADKCPDKNFIFGTGFCHVHTSITAENLKRAKQAKPDALVLAHPECTLEILELADYVGSTSGIIDFATASDAKEFIICTELGVLYELKTKNPDKRFYSVGIRQYCPNMKRITVEKVRDALLNNETQVEISEERRLAALAPLERMLELAK